MGKGTQKQNGKKSGSFYIALLVLFLLSAACIVFEILTVQSFREGFIAQNAWWILLLAIFITLAALCVGIVFLVKEKKTWYKTFLSAFILLLFFLVVLFIIVKTDLLFIFQSPELYQKFLEQTGAWMPILYILLQFLQVVLLPIPSIVSTLAGLALFGPLKTAIFSLIGILAGSFVGFFVGRNLGYKAVAWLVGEEELKKWLKKIKGKDNLILTMMFILPLFPDDVLCFVAGLSTMSTGYFSAMIVVSRIISIFTTCFSVEIIPINEWWGLLTWAVLFAVLLVLFVILYKNIDKINDWLAAKKMERKQKRAKKRENKAQKNDEK
ncbi:MAG: TVP38/TMEM64 family protein [Clostridia bacterium]|nr:TVP38/TMEM64 family protein [Clostridia bacterium]